MNLLQLIIVVLLICLMGSIAFNYYNKPECKSEVVQVAPQEAGNNAITYLNKYFAINTTAVLDNVTEENGLYHLKITISSKQFDSYMTLDGRLLFPSVLDVTKQPVLG